MKAVTGSDGRQDVLLAVTVIFDRAVDAAVATNLGRYRLVSSGADRLLGTTDDLPVALKHAEYDGARRTVTLSPETAAAATQSFRVTVSGPGLSPYVVTLGSR